MTRFPALALAIALLCCTAALPAAAQQTPPPKPRHRGDSATGAEVHLIQFRACGRRGLA
ncbi:MAG: hypothetical protein KKI16_07965 [Alphaproteobacteria bacterium]|nr:hypothetical protein [Alphaproteobacteria bacterium]